VFGRVGQSDLYDRFVRMAEPVTGFIGRAIAWPFKMLVRFLGIEIFGIGLWLYVIVITWIWGCTVSIDMIILTGALAVIVAIAASIAGLIVLWKEHIKPWIDSLFDKRDANKKSEVPKGMGTFATVRVYLRDTHKKYLCRPIEWV
jgi:hypothetical protein